MSRGAVLAAALIGAGLGYSTEAHNHTEYTSSAEDTKLYEEAAYYAPIAAAMVEAAHGVTFAYPDDWKYSIYFNFGDLIGDELDLDTEEDEDSGNTVSTYNLPRRDKMLNELQSMVYNEFAHLCVDAQKESLRSAIAQARKETA